MKLRTSLRRAFLLFLSVLPINSIAFHAQSALAFGEGKVKIKEAGTSSLDEVTK